MARHVPARRCRASPPPIASPSPITGQRRPGGRACRPPPAPQPALSQIRKHLLVTLLSSNASLAINFAASVVLARLLSPPEIGIFSVAFVFTGLFRTLREMGIGAYIVQEPELTAQRFRSAFGVALIMSTVTALAVVLLAPMVGRFYREPGITEVLYVIAANLLITPFGSTTLALVRREMRFTDIAIAETFSTLVQSAASVALAWWGFSYMSLAWSGVLGVVASILAAAYFRPPQTPWWPSLAEWRRVLRFTSFSSGSSLVSYANNSASDLILGRLMNVEAVAIFNRGNGLSGMAGQLIQHTAGSVSLPHFSEACRRGESLLVPISNSTTMIMAISAPVYAVLAVVATPLVLLLYGAPWRDAAPILQILCLAALVWSPSLLTGEVLQATGQIHRLFRLEVWALVLKFALVIAAVPFGLKMVALAYVAANLVATIQRVMLVSRIVGRGMRDLVRSLQSCVFPTLLACLGPLALTNSALDPHLALPASLALAVPGWLAGAMLSRGIVRDEVLAAARKAFPRFGAR